MSQNRTIQSRRVWIGGQFIPAQIEFKEGKIERICPWGSGQVDADYENRYGLADSLAPPS